MASVTSFSSAPLGPCAPDQSAAVAGIDDHGPQARLGRRPTAGGGLGAARLARRPPGGPWNSRISRAGGPSCSRASELLEAAPERDREQVVPPPDELHAVHDAAGQPLLLVGHVEQVARHRHRHAGPPPALTRNGTFSLASRTTRTDSPDTNVVTFTRGAGTLPTSSTREAARHSARLFEQRPEQARQRVHGHEPAAPLVQRGAGHQAQVAADRGQALLVVQRDLPGSNVSVTEPPRASVVAEIPSAGRSA